jgi:hypothetical protein
MDVFGYYLVDRARPLMPAVGQRLVSHVRFRRNTDSWTIAEGL